MEFDDHPELTTEFAISYEGEALAQHSMPVRDLAPALLALGQAFDRANELLNGDRATITLKIHATEQGSFQVDLLLQQMFDQASSVLSAEFISSASHLKQIVVGETGLIGLLKRLRGSRAKEVDRTDSAIMLEFKEARLTVSKDVFALYQDRTLREQLEATVRPLNKPGINRMVFRQQRDIIQTIEKDDVEAFDPDDVDTGSSTETIIPHQRLKIVSPNFEKGKWRLHDGEKARWYSIEDKDFVKDVQEGNRSFRRGDLLICQLIQTQHVDADGNLTLERRISHISKHEHRATQLRLNSGDDALETKD